MTPAPLVACAALLGEAVGDRLRRDEPLGPRTTYRVGGRAALFLEADSEADLIAAARAVGTSGVPVLVVGKGSNLLVADRGFAGLAVVLGDGFSYVAIGDGGDTGDPTVRAGGAATVLVRAGAAAALPVVARRTVAAGLTGFEWAVGVPGSIGGAVRMNAGGHGAELAETLVGVRVVDLAGGEDGGVSRPVDPSELDLGYRRSNLSASTVVVEAALGLAPGDRKAGERELAEVVRWRRDNQPGGPNAGSVFTNPTGDAAGRLVEAAGAKGLRLGTAAVSDKHANFIQADPGGRADDVYALMQEVRRRVADRFGIELRHETILVGFEEPDGIPSSPKPSSRGRGLRPRFP